MEAEKYDEVLLTVAGQCGGIEPLLDVFFSFLYRKTDFFVVMQKGDTKMGFPEGVAEKLVLRSFRQFQQASSSQTQLAKTRAGAAPTSKPAPTPTVSSPATAAATTAAPPPSKPAAAAASAPAAAPAAAPKEKEKDELSYNGGATEQFSWEQTLSDVAIQVPMPEGTRARDVVCTISKSHLLVQLKGQEAVIDADFPCDARNGQEIWEKVRADECYWNLQPGTGGRAPQVAVYLEKERECWWKSALHGAAEIDTTKVDSTRQVHDSLSISVSTSTSTPRLAHKLGPTRQQVYDYDGETQGAIRKIMFDQDQKRRNLPTSDEMQNEDMLRKAWDAEGSPFKGTPFDPKMVNFNGGTGAGAGAGAGPPGID